MAIKIVVLFLMSAGALAESPDVLLSVPTKASVGLVTAPPTTTVHSPVHISTGKPDSDLNTANCLWWGRSYHSAPIVYTYSVSPRVYSYSTYTYPYTYWDTHG